MDSRAVSIWKWNWNPKVDIVEFLYENDGLRTCAKEKHADVIDSLRCRQLEGGLGFIDLL